MSNEFHTIYTTGETLKNCLFNQAGLVLKIAGLVFEAWGTAGRTITDYAITLTESGSSGSYLGNMPAVAAGKYFAVSYDAANSPVYEQNPIRWSGSAVIDEVDIAGRVDLGSIMGETLDDYNAVLKLKQLLVQNTDGTAVQFEGGNGGAGAYILTTGIAGDGLICQGGVEMGNGLSCIGGGGDIDAAEIDSIPAAAAAAILAKTGITAGGTWTLAKLLKVLAAILSGKVRDKSGSTTIKEVLDAEDGATVIAEWVPAATTPYRTLTIL
jgi:hypothetical protein